jgi:hypothetical protein
VSTRQQNERKFGHWEDVPQAGRRYWLEVASRSGWKVRYVKEVDLNEITILFYQEVYNEIGELVEVHHKYPVDLGHRKV